MIKSRFGLELEFLATGDTNRDCSEIIQNREILRLSVTFAVDPRFGTYSSKS